MYINQVDDDYASRHHETCQSEGLWPWRRAYIHTSAQDLRVHRFGLIFWCWLERLAYNSMALPYPEGAVYFKRSVLNLKTPPYNFDAQDDSAFYSHCLLENTWNTWAFSSHTTPDINHIPSHIRSKAVRGYGQNYNTQFGKSHSILFESKLSLIEIGRLGVWGTTSIMFSNEKDGQNYLHEVVLDNNQNFNELRDRDDGGPLKTILRPVPMANTRYMLVDWVNPFRAIYFPLAHQAGPGYEDLCVYLMIDFRLRKGVQMYSPYGDNKWLSLNFNRETGLTYRHQDTMSFDLKGIYNYLVLPQQLRDVNKGLYKSADTTDQLIVMYDMTRPSFYMRKVATRPFVREMDLAKVISDNFGVDVTWQPYEYSSWVVNFIVKITTVGLGFIPVVGPLLAVSFSVGLQAITDPDAFTEENILDLSVDVIAGIVSAGQGVGENLPKSFKTSKAKLLVVQGPSQGAQPEPGSTPKQEVQDEGKLEAPDEGKQEAQDEGKQASEQEA